MGSETYNNRSSALRESLWTRPWQAMPLNPSWFYSQMANGSIAMLNNKGKSGQPWCVSRWSRKGGERVPLVCTNADEKACNSQIQEMNLGSNPNSPNANNRYFHFTVSKAFSASNETITLGVLGEGEKTILNNLRVLKRECLSNVKPVWSDEMMAGVTSWRWREDFS